MNQDFDSPLPSSSLPFFALLGGLILLVLLPTVTWLPGENWHDRQRIGQIVLIACTAMTGSFMIFSFKPLPYAVSRVTFFLIVGLVLVGAMSSVRADAPIWAFTELATFFGCAGIAWFIAIVRITGGALVDRMLLGSVVLTCAALSIQVGVSYASTILVRLEPVDPWGFLGGFSNLRFFGQFISLSLPLLAAPAMVPGQSRPWRIPTLLLLVVWWAIAICSGTRGTWLGLAVASTWLCFMGEKARRWVTLQVFSAIGGGVLFFICMNWIPQIADLEVANHASSRLTASLSGREVLWIQAVSMIVERPLLGFGPMHFASIANAVAAHPHQALLQLASEWGLPFSVAVTFGVGLAACSVFRCVRAEANLDTSVSVLRLCLSASLVASLTQAMVDGVLVMPYTQVWLALVSGWLLALHPRRESTVGPSATGRLLWTGGLILAAGLLVGVLVRDYPRLNELENSYVQQVGGHLQPRFWQQGVIVARGQQNSK
ncbi:O-antigen ligase [Thauera sp. 2A1]|uniref:O-antigen ligase family protein n=1 Tax=Thauera sp. 2A1 TaxID=2570191 RepID=UPI0012919B60|nr:O-antigen ligase family protein [Thauera sp. 2A1]KAI5916297.1 O-antigen ligase family protein [Thauera sp. 2A1]